MKKEEKYIIFFEKLNRDTPLSDYYEIFDENVELKDPFHHTFNINILYSIFQKLYETMFSASFKILKYSSKGNDTFILWTFTYQLNQTSEVEHFDGMSHVVFGNNNKVIRHIDYWDACENIYEKFPFLGSILRLIKKQFRIENE